VVERSQPPERRLRPGLAAPHFRPEVVIRKRWTSKTFVMT
jgi:hypothetical protein